MEKRHNTKQAAELLKEKGCPFTENTLAVWRCLGKGPRFIRIGGNRGRVFYEESALDEFLTGQSVHTVDK